MGIKGVLFMAIALVGVIVNFSSKKLSDRFSVSELALKLAALITVILAVTLLMIFGK